MLPSSVLSSPELKRASVVPSFPDNWFTSQNHYHDMHNFHHSYVAPEVSNEVHLFNEFLVSSLMDESPFGDDPNQTTPLGLHQPDPLSRFSGSHALLPPGAMQGGGLMAPPSAEQHAKTIARPNSVQPVDKAGEFYLEAADPHGDDSPEERMKLILDAKVKAGLLKPFNYINGYARLASYLDTHVSPTSKHKILKILDGFRPKFRDRIQHLNTTDLMVVEMWFEKSLLECDRLFASMAIPACCWRRTGEIFRGNKEMAELLNVPIEHLRGVRMSWGFYGEWA